MSEPMPKEIIATHYFLDGTESSGYWAGLGKTVSAHVAWTRYIRADADAEVRRALANELQAKYWIYKFADWPGSGVAIPDECWTKLIAYLRGESHD